jgi:very-short-patch-repair endonuclease
VPPLPPGLPLFVASGRSDRIKRRGVRACRHDVLQRWELVHGVRTASAAETVLACARDLGLLDVVLIGDAALHAKDVTKEQLVVAARQRRRGAPLLRRAIALMDGRAESIFEGLLRLLHVACDIDVEPQHLVMADDGDVVARGDLLLVGTRMLHELDGGHHRLAEQHRRDLRRHRRLLEAGYERRGFTSHDVLLGSLGILRDADATLGREHDASRIQPWYSLLQGSLFTGAGRSRLELRIGLGGKRGTNRPPEAGKPD